MNPPVKGRFAPSPSGRMHLGNVFAALMSWLSAKSRGGKWVLRIEDLDRQRSRMEFARLIEDDLQWLGLQWDEGGVDGSGPGGPWLQSLRDDFYLERFNQLLDDGLLYRCLCTKADIMATQAPHESDGRVVYPGTCRPAPEPPFPRPESAQGSWRLFVPDADIRFTDRNYGPQSVNLRKHCGDFIVRRADGAWAYQLAVVADDAAMGVTEVVRGADLLLSSAQQIYLYNLFRLPAPEFAHIPLVCNASGQRLSKRDASLSMAELRKTHSPEALVGILAHLAGLIPDPSPVSPADLLGLTPNLPVPAPLQIRLAQ